MAHSTLVEWAGLPRARGALQHPSVLRWSGDAVSQAMSSVVISPFRCCSNSAPGSPRLTLISPDRGAAAAPGEPRSGSGVLPGETVVLCGILLGRGPVVPYLAAPVVFFTLLCPRRNAQWLRAAGWVGAGVGRMAVPPR